MSNKRIQKEAMSYPETGHNDIKTASIPSDIADTDPAVVNTLLDKDVDVHLTKETEEVVNEIMQVETSKIMNDLGILTKTLNNPALKAKASEAISIMVNSLKELGFPITLKASVHEGDDKSDDDKTGLVDADLYNPDEEFEERKTNEDFDAIMEELDTNDGPVVEIQENVNPRIKKRDLVNYLKNKKDAK